MLNRRAFLGLVGAVTANIGHLDGAGIAKANLLARATASDQIHPLQAGSGPLHIRP